MKNKGFTLVELLAVIAILGVIALITIPLVFNSINESKEESAKISVSNYIKAVKQSILTHELDDLIIEDGIYEINGKYLEKGSISFKVSYDGEGLEQGYVKIVNGEVIKLIDTKINKWEAVLEKGKVVLYKYFPSSTLVTGKEFAQKVKQLANPDTTVTYEYNDDNISSLGFYSKGKLPDGYTKETLQTLSSVSVSSDGSIIAYLDDAENSSYQKNIYVYSDNKIKMNQDSSYLLNWIDSTKNLEDLDTSNVIDMSYMFYGVMDLSEADLSNFDTSNVTNMSNMFAGPKSGITHLDLSNFDTSNVTNMTQMFNALSNNNPISIDVSSFNTSNVIDMTDMFRQCLNTTTLDISSFNTSNACTNFMFDYSGITKLIINNTSMLNYSSSIFDNSSIANGTGYIYVPDSMLNTYKTDSNWSTYTNQFKSVDELSS